MSSSDEYPAAKTKGSTSGSDPVHKKSGTTRFMTGANENRIFIAIIIACILGAWNVVVNTIKQPLVDQAQNVRMDGIEKRYGEDLSEMKDDIKSLLGRASND